MASRVKMEGPTYSSRGWNRPFLHLVHEGDDLQLKCVNMELRIFGSKRGEITEATENDTKKSFTICTVHQMEDKLGRTCTMQGIDEKYTKKNLFRIMTGQGNVGDFSTQTRIVVK
jgi:hypothetical protein